LAHPLCFYEITRLVYIYVARGKLFPESTVRNITIQVMNGLAFMHKYGQCVPSSFLAQFTAKNAKIP